MTTEKQEVVSATTEDAGKVADAVSAAQDKAPAPEEKPPATDTPAGITIEDLQSTFKSFEGRNANYNADRFRTIKSELSTEIETALAPLKETMSNLEQARVSELDPEQQADYWKKKATETPKPAPEPAPQAVGAEYTDTQRLQLANETTAMLTQMKVQVPYTDDRLWAGATTGMSVAELGIVARGNASRLQTGPVATPVTPVAADDPPPSTQDAPVIPSSPIESKTDAAQALARQEINSDDYRKLGIEQGWLRQF